MNTRKTVLIALLSCMALCIYAVESLISPLVPIPGVKLGLSNVVTLVAMYVFGKKEAFCVLFIRIFLSFLLFGQAMSLAFSIGGGLLCFGAMCIASRLLEKSQVWAVSIIGAIFHSIGQIIIAVTVTSQPSVAYYFLLMLIFSVVTGLFTGLCARYSIDFLQKNFF